MFIVAHNAMKHFDLMANLHASHDFELVFGDHEHKTNGLMQVEYLLNQKRLDEVCERSVP